MSIVITGATGQLGRLVIAHLLKKVPASQIVATVRNVEKASDLADLGIELRYGDYNDPASLPAAFAGAEKLMFIPSPDMDSSLRIAQHASVAKAARDAGVGHIAYAGIAFAEKATVPLALVHLATEYAVRATNIPFTFLRNSFYTEVFVTPGLQGAVATGELITNAGAGRLNTVTRNDLALAAAAVLTGEGHENKTYNLASAETWTFDDLARILSEVSGKRVVHRNVSFDGSVAHLVGAGLPEPVAGFFAGLYGAIAQGETAHTSTDLQSLIGAQTPFAETVRQALQG